MSHHTKHSILRKEDCCAMASNSQMWESLGETGLSICSMRHQGITTRTGEMGHGSPTVSVQHATCQPTPAATTHVRPEVHSYPCPLSRVPGMIFTCKGPNFRSVCATCWMLKIHLFLSSKPQRCFMKATPIKQERAGAHIQIQC